MVCEGGSKFRAQPRPRRSKERPTHHFPGPSTSRHPELGRRGGGGTDNDLIIQTLATNYKHELTCAGDADKRCIADAFAIAQHVADVVSRYRSILPDHL